MTPPSRVPFLRRVRYWLGRYDISNGQLVFALALVTALNAVDHWLGILP